MNRPMVDGADGDHTEIEQRRQRLIVAIEACLNEADDLDFAFAGICLNDALEALKARRE